MENVEALKRTLNARQYMVLEPPYLVAIGRGTIRIMLITSTPRKMPLQEVRRLLGLFKILGDQPTVTVEAWRPKSKGRWFKEALLVTIKGRAACSDA